MSKYVIGLLMFLAIVLFALSLAVPVQAEATDKTEAQPELKKIEATAYYDSYGHGYGADGRQLIENLTIAGRVEDLGKTALLYDEDMRLIGIYEFRDTGYGQSTGRGKSQVCKGQPVGTIESGQCVDIYMPTKAKCTAWGRRKVYIQYVNAVG